MADFSINATQLSAPQGAGSAPISAAPSALAGIVETIGGAVNIFARGLEREDKAKAEQAKAGVLRSYSRKLETINQGLRSGQLSPTEARSRQRATASEFMGAYGDMTPDIEKITKAFTGTTELSDAEAQLEAETQGRNELIKKAQAAGFEIGRGEPESAVNAKLAAYQAAVRADDDVRRLYQRQEAERAQGRYNQEQQDRERKEVALKAIGDIAGANYEVAYQEVGVLSDAVASGKMQAPQAQALWQSKMARIHTALVEVAKSNPELASTHRGLFDKIEKLGNDMLDPNKRSEALKGQLDAILNQAKLTIVQNPQAAKVVAASQLFGNNSQLMLGSSSKVSEIIASMIDVGPEASTAPPVIGTPESKTVFKVLKESVDKANTGGYEDKVKANKEISNLSNHMLQQFGEAAGKRGFDVKSLSDAAEFFASSSFGKFASENKLDTESIAAAYKTFQSVYQPTVVDAVSKAVTQVFTKQDRFGSKSNAELALEVSRTGKPTKEQSTLKSETKGVNSQKVVPVFNTTGVTFKLSAPSTDPQERAAEQRMLLELQQSERAITRLVHIGAHLEGTTDYNKFWEANKHELLPMFFSAPEAIKSSSSASSNYSTESGMKAEVSKVASEGKKDTDANIEHRRKQDIIAIKNELANKNLAPAARAILEAELAKLEK